MQRHSLQEGHGFFPSRVAVSQCGASLRGVDWWSVEMGRSETSFIRDWDERRVFLTVLLTEKIRAQPSCCLQLLTSDLSLWKPQMAAYKLVLIRHGESCWNQENRFCGWFDADLSETGAQEAKKGGQALKGLYSFTFSRVVNERCKSAVPRISAF